MAHPLHAPTGLGGHRPACMWARKRGDPVESRVYLFILFLRIYFRILHRDLGSLDHLSCLQLCRLIPLWARVVGGRGAVESPHTHPVRGVRVPSLAGLGMVEVPLQDLMGLMSSTAFNQGCDCPTAALWRHWRSGMSHCPLPRATHLCPAGGYSCQAMGPNDP